MDPWDSLNSPEWQTRHPWERHPGESAKAFEAFGVYRDLGPRRSIRETARHLGKQPSLLERWSSKHDWVGRAAASDEYLDRRAHAAATRARARAVSQIMVIDERLSEALLQRLTGDEEAGIAPLDPGELSWADIARLMRLIRQKAR